MATAAVKQDAQYYGPFTFERTEDYEIVRQIITHPLIYPHVADDGSPPPEEFHPIQSNLIWYVLVRDGEGRLLGLWTFMPHNSVCWEVHTCLLPAVWGKAGRDAALEMQQWIWENTPCRRIITNVPRPNLLALKFAEAAGMTVFGINERSYLKHGVLHDQIMLGVSKPEDT